MTDSKRVVDALAASDLEANADPEKQSACMERIGKLPKASIAVLVTDNEKLCKWIAKRLTAMLAIPSPRVQDRAATCVVNLSWGDSRFSLMFWEAETVAALVKLWPTNDIPLKETVIWALAHLAHDLGRVAEMRTTLWGHICQTLGCKHIGIRSNALGCLQQLVRTGSPPLSLNYARQALAAVGVAMEGHDDVAVFGKALWVLDSLCDRQADDLAEFVNSRAVETCVRLLVHGSSEVREAAVKVVGTLVGNTQDVDCKRLIRFPTLANLCRLLTDPQRSLRSVRRVSFIISNLCLSPHGAADVDPFSNTEFNQTTELVLEAGFLRPLVQSLNHSLSSAQALGSSSSSSSSSIRRTTVGGGDTKVEASSDKEGSVNCAAGEAAALALVQIGIGGARPVWIQAMLCEGGLVALAAVLRLPLIWSSKEGPDLHKKIIRLFEAVLTRFPAFNVQLGADAPGGGMAPEHDSAEIRIRHQAIIALENVNALKTANRQQNTSGYDSHAVNIERCWQAIADELVAENKTLTLT